MTEAEAKDAILRFILEGDEQTFNAYHIEQRKILEGNPLGTIEVLIKKIGRTDPEVADVTIAETGYFIRRNNFTSVFLEQGGFTKHESDSAEQKRELEEREQLELELAKSNLRANQLNEEIAERNRKSQRFNKIFLIINALFALTNIAIAIIQWLSSGQPE